MRPDQEAKIEAARARREREKAALQSQIDVLAGRRDAFGNPIVSPTKAAKEKAAKLAKRRKYKAKRAAAVKLGQPCRRCQRPMASTLREGFVRHLAHGLCTGCEGREDTPSRWLVLDNCEECGRAMRAPGVSAKDSPPDRVARKSNRRCLGCAQGRAVAPRAFMPEKCVACSLPLRKRGAPKTPGTRLVGSFGMCATCYKRSRGEM